MCDARLRPNAPRSEHGASSPRQCGCALSSGPEFCQFNNLVVSLYASGNVKEWFDDTCKGVGLCDDMRSLSKVVLAHFSGENLIFVSVLVLDHISLNSLLCLRLTYCFSFRLLS